MLLLGLDCGCKDSKSVSVSSATVPSTTHSSSSDMKSTIQAVHGTGRDVSSADTLMLTSPTTSSYWEEEEAAGKPPSFSGLLRQLGEMEQDVMAWGRGTPPPSVLEPEKRRRRSRSRSSSGGAGRAGRRVEESVAVVKETEDPLGEFRRSMLQMIVEKEIVGGEELRELLQRFLSLNSPRYHDTILQAFAEIWEEVFSGYEHTPELLRRHTGPNVRDRRNKCPRDTRLPPAPRRL